MLSVGNEETQVKYFSPRGPILCEDLDASYNLLLTLDVGKKNCHKFLSSLKMIWVVMKALD